MLIIVAQYLENRLEGNDCVAHRLGVSENQGVYDANRAEQLATW